jgi:hypothetical protein
VIGLPDGCLEPLAGSVADGDVGEEVVPVVGDEGVGEEDPEGVLGLGGEDVVAEGAVATVGCPGGVEEEGGEVFEAALGGVLAGVRGGEEDEGKARS